MGRKRRIVQDTPKREPVNYTNFWSDRELVDLAFGLQEFGFAETKKIAENVKTKSEHQIKLFLSMEASKLRQRFIRKREGKRLKSSWAFPEPADIVNWPNVRKWRRVVHDQHLPCVKKQDYSKILLPDLIKTFYEEAEDTNDPEVINFKAIYKYLYDCFLGFVPAELSPIDSGIVLIMLGQLIEMHRNYDFSEENSFINNFTSAKTFVPFKVKDEFREKTRKRTSTITNGMQSSKTDQCGVPGTSSNGNTIAQTVEVKKEKGDENDTIKVVEEMYYKLTKHRKMVQSFNPLNIPLWNIVREQNYVLHKCDEASSQIRPFPENGSA